jgi:16S rRNA (cytosine967-C5)-methyltransferase
MTAIASSRSAALAPALFAHAETALAQLLTFASPADKALSRYFREHHQLGHADRGRIAELVFGVLRRWRTLTARADGEATPRRLLLAALIQQGRNLRELEGITTADERAWLSQIKGNFDESTLSPAQRLDLPDWLHDRLLARFGAAETRALALALNRPAPLDLRVNDLKSKRLAVLEQFAAEGIAAQTGKLSPFAVRLSEKPALARHPLFLAGAFEIQDEGSQLLGLLLNPRRGEMVADFCAGAGGKTLLLGALMRNTGRLYAFDVSEKRLANLKPRLARSGLSNVYPVKIESERDSRVKRLAGKLDRVLVDAPCSGLGTLRRNPDLKWRQTPASVAELAQKQSAILAAAATLLRPGGRLVYATCSLLPEENDQVVDAFLAARPDFALLPVDRELERLGWADHEPRLQLLPHRHDTDGFYAVLLERKSAL